MKYICTLCCSETSITYGSDHGMICEKCFVLSLEEENTARDSKNASEGQNGRIGGREELIPADYTMLPVFIRYDKALTHLQKILYAEITSMANKNGYCSASNEYFSSIYGNSEKTISRAITELAGQGYITTQVEKLGFSIYVRKIFVNKQAQKKANRKITKQIKKNIRKNLRAKVKRAKRTKIKTKKEKPCQKSLRNNSIYSNNIENIYKKHYKIDTNTLYNNKYNNTTIVDIVDDPKHLRLNGFYNLPSLLGKSPLERVLRIYTLEWNKVHDTEYAVKTKNPQVAKLIEEVLVRYGEYTVGFMMILHFNWKGMDDDSESVLKGLRDAGYPLSQLYTNASLYKSYINNRLGLDSEDKRRFRLDSVLKDRYKVGNTCNLPVLVIQ